MIKSIEIKKLFGKFNYSLEFNNESIMIITGPNGFGKSTILRMVNSIFGDSIESIYKYEFGEIIIDFELNNQSLHILKGNGYIDFNKLRIQLPNGIEEIEKNYNDVLYKLCDGDIDGVKSRIYRRLDCTHMDKLLIEDFAFLKIFNYFFSDRRNDSFDSKIKNLYKIKKLIDKYKHEIGDINFIREQRLIEEQIKIVRFNEQERIHRNTIILKSNDIEEKLNAYLDKYSKLSNELDSTYLMRLFKGEKKKVNSLIEMQDRLNIISENQIRLRKYGFAANENVFNKKINKRIYDRFKNELDIYIEDMEKKFSVYGEIVKKIELYEKIVNSKLQFKKISISIECGIRVIGEDGKNIELTDLSSGEQEIIVLYYKLIFESATNLVLIDEPEISLHIVWQLEFMKDIKEIFELNSNFEIIIATHSPQIINGNSEFQIDLGGQYNASNRRNAKSKSI